MDKDIRLHESNKSFSWTMPDGPYTFFSDEDITLFNEKGYVVLELSLIHISEPTRP